MSPRIALCSESEVPGQVSERQHANNSDTVEKGFFFYQFYGSKVPNYRALRASILGIMIMVWGN